MERVTVKMKDYCFSKYSTKKSDRRRMEDHDHNHNLMEEDDQEEGLGDDGAEDFESKGGATGRGKLHHHVVTHTCQSAQITHNTGNEMHYVVCTYVHCHCLFRELSLV